MAASWTVVIIIIVIIVVVVIIVIIIFTRISHHDVIVFHEVHDVDWLVWFGVAKRQQAKQEEDPHGFIRRPGRAIGKDRG